MWWVEAVFLMGEAVPFCVCAVAIRGDSGVHRPRRGGVPWGIGGWRLERQALEGSNWQ